MLNLYPRLSADSTDGDDNAVNSCRVLYAIAVVGISIFIFCALVGSSSIAVWQACAVAALSALIFGVIIGYLAPKIRVQGTGRPAASTLLPLTAAPGRARAPGCACVLPANVPLPPAFAYVTPPLESDGGGNQEATTARCVMCPVCLEDVQGGEMVRQLECRHIFHVECVDMWLQSHRTCPMCRYVIKPPVMLTLKAAATSDEVPESSGESSLPPV